MKKELEIKIVRSEEEQKKANEMFDDLRDELLKRDLSNTENYDKAILTLSSASLGLSLTAIKLVVPLESAKYLWLVKLGWTLLLISIITSLIAFLMSNKAISLQLNNARKYYKEGISNAFNKTNIFTKINTGLNYTTGISFLSAISVIVLFVSLNIETEAKIMTNETENTNSATVVIKKSANIPTMEQAPETTVTTPASESDSNQSGNTSTEATE